MTGEGVKEFFEAVDKARTEYETYVPFGFALNTLIVVDVLFFFFFPRFHVWK